MPRDKQLVVQMAKKANADLEYVSGSVVRIGQG